VSQTALAGLGHTSWQSTASPCVATRQAQIAVGGGADRRSAKIAAAPMNQSREAHRSARPLHSPEGASRRGTRLVLALLLQVVADYKRRSCAKA
jgi:hypothetical protein